jgi:RimJ/RimL family protein N-acetyltransferase
MTANSNTSNDMSNQNAVRIEPWDKGDLPLLKLLLGDPAMTRHLGGPESDEKLARRQTLFEHLAESGEGRMFKIIHEATGEAVGSVGYWDSTWHDQPIYEIGWSVLPAFQGQGIASAATAQAIVMTRADGKHRFLHAFPSIDNPPSNAVCRKTGFMLIEECDFEYPKGHAIRCNDWRLDLSTNNE